MKKLDSRVIRRIVEAPSLVLFLDYDGTLTRIVSKPGKAVLSAAVRGLLKRLHRLKGVMVAMISGRSLKSLKRYVGIPELLFAGNHGFEIGGPGIFYVHPMARKKESFFEKIAGHLQKDLSCVKGIFVEHKVFTISIHYRQVRDSLEVGKAKRILKARLASIRNVPVVMVEGKKVWEIRPTADWHKGAAVSWLMRHLNSQKDKAFFPVYIGDDTTDEDAFRVVREKGVGIKVTSGKGRGSWARYGVRSPAEVVRFLRKISSLRKMKHP